MEAKATARFVRVSPNKARRVVDMIRGQAIGEARRILEFSPLGATAPVAKVLNSAAANAEQRVGEPLGDGLIVKGAYVDEGPTLKRFRPRAQGRATRIRKRTSHITVVVETIGGAVGPQG